MKVILLDDEITALDELEYYLKRYKEVEIVGIYDNPIKALEESKTKHFDAAFLDINMPVVNGINVAKEFMEFSSNIKIVFTTAYDEYAVKAFELNAVDYILKPIEKGRLDKAVERLLRSEPKNSNIKKTIMDKLNRIEKNIRQDSERIKAFDADEITLLKMSEVLFLESELGKTYIATQSGRFKTKETLEFWEAKLHNYGFFRCHRSYLVNLRYVNRISPMFNNNYILRQDGSTKEIPVSRNQIKELKQLLGL